MPGFTFFKVWGTENGEAAPTDPSCTSPYWPAPGGTRCLLVRWEPEGAVDPTIADPEAALAEAEAELPGLLASFEEGSAMHRSETIDYGVVLEGEIWLELDDGEEVRLAPGACVVQRGTRHAWSNRGDKPALMLFVLVGTGSRA
jgi:quercetin dioxygenase-like cupin family protein